MKDGEGFGRYCEYMNRKSAKKAEAENSIILLIVSYDTNDEVI